MPDVASPHLDISETSRQAAEEDEKVRQKTQDSKERDQDCGCTVEKI